MKNIIYITLILIFSACTNNAQDIKSMNTQEAKQYMEKNPGYVLLDVRTPEEVSEGKIQDALHINFYDEDFRSQLEKLDKDKTYIVYCRSGNRSGQAAEIMNEMKFKEVINLDGGIEEWEK